MKFIPLGTVLEDVQQDYETAQKVLPGSGKQGIRLLALLKERIPGLDTEVPEIYRSSTRKLI